MSVITNNETKLTFSKVSVKEIPRSVIPPLKIIKIHHLMGAINNPQKKLVKSFRTIEKQPPNSSENRSRNQHSILSSSHSVPNLVFQYKHIFQNPALKHVLQNLKHPEQKLNVIDAIHNFKINSKKENHIPKKVSFNYKLKKRNHDALKIFNLHSNRFSNSVNISSNMSPLKKESAKHNNIFSFHSLNPHRENGGEVNSLKQLYGIYYKGIRAPEGA